jgi:lipopolysaccharide export system permease protein
MRIRIRPGFLLGRFDLAFVRDFLPPFFAGSTLVAFLLTLLQLFKFSEDFIKFGIDLDVFYPVFSQYFIIFLPMILMVGYVTGVVFAICRMSNDSEITAWKAAGYRMHQLLRPSLVIAVLLSVANLFIAVDTVPRQERKLYRMIQEMTKAEVTGAIRGGVFRTNFFGLTLYADESNEGTGHLKRVFLFDQRKENEPQIISAAEGDLISLESNTNFSASLLLRLHNGSILLQDANAPDAGRLKFQYYEILIEPKQSPIGSSSKTRLIPGTELPDQIRAETDPQRKRSLINELMKRLVFSIAFLPLAFFSVGLSIQRTRSRRLPPTLIVLGAVVLFWVSYLVFSSLSVNGAISPWVGPLAPVFFVTLIGAWATRRSSW